MAGLLCVLAALAVLFLGCAFLTLKAGLHSALAPLTALSLAALVLTMAGIAGLLAPGLALVCAAYTAAGVWALAGARGRLGALITPGSLLFWGMTLFFAVYFFIRQPLCLDYDELSFWATAAKLTATDNALFTTAQVGWPWQATQTPGLILLGYFFQFWGGYADWKLYLAYNALAFACFAAVLGALKKQHWQLAVGLGAILWATPWFFTTYNHTVYLSTVYLSAYGDIPAGLVVGGAVALWLALRHTGGPVWAVLPVLGLAAEIKSNTFVLSLVAAGLIAADEFLFGWEERFSHGIGKRLGFCAACMAAPLAVYLIWSRYVAALAVQNAAAGGMGQTSEDIVSVAVNGIRLLLGLPVGEYYRQRQPQYAKACADMLHQYLTSDGKLSMIGCGLYVTAFILLVFALAWLAARERLRWRVLAAAALSCAGFAAYQFMLALSYGFIFKPFQAENLVDYNRYAYTYYIAWFLIALAFLALALAGRPRVPLAGQAAVLALAVLMLVRLNQLVLPQLSVLGFSDSEFAERRQQQRRAAAVTGMLQPGDRVFYVSQGDNGLDWFTACYDFYPVTVDYSGYGGGTFGLAALDPGGESTVSYYYHPCAAEEFSALVQNAGCTVLYLDAVDDIFTQSYAPLFTDGLDAARAGDTLLYRVTPAGYAPVEMEVPQ